MLHFCQYCYEARVKSKRNRFCSRSCKAKAASTCHRNITPEGAARGREKAAERHRQLFHARMRSDVLKLIGEMGKSPSDTFTLSDVVAFWARLNRQAYIRGWNACWQGQRRRKLKAIKQQQERWATTDWAKAV